MRLLAIELSKVTRRPRTYLGYAGVLFLLVPFVLMLRHVKPEDLIRHQLGGDFEVIGSFFNALFLAHLIMEPHPILMFFLPLFASAVAGDLVAGEAAEGTLRTLLVRPVGRARVLLAKLGVAVLHSASLTLFLGVASLGIGALFFGFGDLYLFDEGFRAMPMHEALLRLLAAYSASILGVLAVASTAFLFSVVLDSAIFATGAAMMLVIVCGILGVIPYFEEIQPYLLTTHMRLWRHLFAQEIPWGELWTSAAWLVGYIVVCTGAALAVFCRKDILS